MSVDVYRTQSPWTDPGPFTDGLRAIDPTPSSVVRAVSGLLLHPMTSPLRGIFPPPAAAGDRLLRSVAAILTRVLARDASPLTSPRAPDDRAFCVCAGFARIATAVFRAHGVPARCRVGFAAYFNPGYLEDHWVSEYWDGAGWHLLDAQLDDEAIRMSSIGFAPEDVPREQFVVAPAAWQRLRAGELDPARMGLSVLGLVGAWFAAGNLMLDAAALNKEEMLPWEKWSIGRELGPGSTVPPEWGARFDAVAAELADAPDAERAARVYREHEWLRVTPMVLSFGDGPPKDVPSAPDV
jgi:hypothetical protein